METRTTTENKVEKRQIIKGWSLVKKIYVKTIIASLFFVIASVLIISSTYAWFSMSNNPIAEGISVSIGGNNTIQVAANIMEVVDGTTCNYPGEFSGYLNIDEYEEYDYLAEVAGLCPVSTSDGEHWYYATYYQTSDEEVVSGAEVSGAIKPISEFSVDDRLSLANVSKGDISDVPEGHYVYLDFWVVSAMDYDLRVATSANKNENDGSFVIDLLDPVVIDSDEDGEVDSYTLSEPEQSVASSVRVGFLTSANITENADLMAYIDSEYYDSTFTKLIGQYQEKGESASYTNQNSFTIYEPNGDLHMNDEVNQTDTSVAYKNGDYVITEPIGLVNGEPDYINVQNILSVQLNNNWSENNDGEFEILTPFLASVIEQDVNEDLLSDLSDQFYSEYLQDQVSYYVDKSVFLTDTLELYEAQEDNIVSGEAVSTLETGGATETTYITSLEANVPQRIRMFIWIEGQDVDCVSQVTSTSFAVGIELAGSNQ